MTKKGIENGIQNGIKVRQTVRYVRNNLTIERRNRRSAYFDQMPSMKGQPADNETLTIWKYNTVY